MNDEQTADVNGVQPGPSALLRKSAEQSDIEVAASLIMRFSKKGEGRFEATVSLEKKLPGKEKSDMALEMIRAFPMSDEVFQEITS